MSHRVERHGSATVLVASGRIDFSAAVGFQSQLEALTAAKDVAGALIIDCAELEYVSSAGLRCFMLASRQAKAQSGRIFVAALQPMVAEIFEISHFNLVFQVFPSVREALGTVSAEAAAAFDKG